MKILAFLLVLTTLFTALAYSMQTGIAAQAIIDARRDAKKDVNIVQWFGLGCCFTGITYAASVVLTPEIPINRLIGKSPEYVFFYSQEYQRKTRSLQNMYTVLGWVTGVVVVVGYYVAKDERPPFLR